jgi:hypothetical protein
MRYSLEEINLMCIYDCTSRSGLIGDLEDAMEYVDEPEMLRLMELTIDKLCRTTDAQFSALPLVPAWENADEADSV